MARRQTPPASDNIEIDDKHLRERFVAQKTYLDHCTGPYKRADVPQIMNSRARAGTQQALSGPLISITGLISLPPASFRSLLAAPRISHRSEAKGP